MTDERRWAASEGDPQPGFRLEIVPGGPVLARGLEEVETADGRRVTPSRPVVAICVCGFSQRAPWCDGTHKVARRGSAPDEPEHDPAPRSGAQLGRDQVGQA
ncbi:CDGSH iron-sulfur domain-containing protein [Marmoricola sp. RAF53]|uniref:CDGSH iron-sulfur domain-containing protein n=1 Tax=Marmoricola sp. RAF53 TaxID=3233059 RepID=UPI003F965395